MLKPLHTALASGLTKILIAAAIIGGTSSAALAENTFLNCDVFAVEISPEEGLVRVIERSINKTTLLSPSNRPDLYLNDAEEMSLGLEAGDSWVLWLGDASFPCTYADAAANTSQNQTHASGAVGGNETYLNIPGQSLGGNLRNGPGTNFTDIGSLSEGTPITIVANTGVGFNGYDWFEIKYQGRTSYQWGGIMCANGGTPGILVACENAGELLHPNAGSTGLKVAKSWGGKVRSGPGTNYSQLGSFAEGDPITVIRNTGVRFNGYDWYEVRFNGRTGYHWGGIMCSDYDDLPGTFSPCNSNAALQNHNNNGGNASTGNANGGFMAFAIGSNGRYGHGYAPTRQKAENNALEYCGESACRIEDVTQEQCHALATVPGGFWFGAASTERAAMDTAAGYCSSATGQTCNIDYVYCR